MPPSAITVTIGIDWKVKAVGKPVPANYTTQVSNGTVLVDILNKAAGENKQGPYNRYSTTYYAGLGHMIIAMNGTWQKPENGSYWTIYDDNTGKLTPVGMDLYKPKNGSSTTFRLVPGAGHGPITSTERPNLSITNPSSSDKSAGAGVVTLFLLAVLEGFMFS